MKSHFRIWMLWTWVLSTVCVYTALAQAQDASQEDLKSKYEKGKQLYGEGKYALAIEAFRPLSRIDKGNPYVEYASFFFGLSAFRDGNYDLAKNMFLQIRDKYPRWDKIDQVNYWLANTYFKQGEWEQAIKLTGQISSKSKEDRETSEDAMMMKRYFLATSANDSLLQTLLEKFPEDKAIAEQLVSNISQSFYDANKRSLLDSLVKAFHLDMGELGAVSKEASVKKSVYNVAVMLPFLYDKLSPEMPRQGNQFVLDLYKGIETAVKDLNAEGINIQLHAYDTRKSYEDTKNLLSQEEMKNMDVIIGPLYPGPNQAVSEFSMKNRIYMFNPLSNNPRVIGNNPFSYLMFPSVITEAKAAAQLAAGKLGSKEAFVITGASSQDSMRVSSFIQNFEKDTTYTVEVVVKTNFYRESMDELVDSLRELDEGSIIYVASDDQLVISNVVSALVMAGVRAPLIGNEEWLNISTISYDQLEELQVYLISPGYTDYGNQKLESFKERFRKRQYELVNKYILSGYDMMYYIGQMMNKYGIYFQEFFKEGQNVNSLFFSGYNYLNANDNQRVPIVQFKDAEIVVVSEL